MDDNKNKAPGGGSGAEKSSRDPGKKRYNHKKNKRPRKPAPETAAETVAVKQDTRPKQDHKPRKEQRPDRGAENKKPDADAAVQAKPEKGRNDRGGNRNPGGRGNGRGGKNRRPQIHDGFDDIRMNPRYVMVDNDDRDDFEDTAAPETDGRNVNPGVTVGRNAVRELLRSGRPIDKIYVKSGSREGSVVVIVAEAISRGIPIVESDQNKLDRIAGGGNHQGVVAMSAGKEYCTVDDILDIAAAKGEKPLIVVSDGIEDPHNLGALIRCAECAGAHGIIIPKRRNVGITPVVAKCSAGAIEHVAVAKVTNLATTLKSLKEAGIWIFAAEAGGEAYYDADMAVPAAVVFGSEGDGVSRIVKELSDFTVSIPMYGLVNSLNVSTAASVILCHAARVRHGKA